MYLVKTVKLHIVLKALFACAAMFQMSKSIHVKPNVTGIFCHCYFFGILKIVDCTFTDSYHQSKHIQDSAKAVTKTLIVIRKKILTFYLMEVIIVKFILLTVILYSTWFKI